MIKLSTGLTSIPISNVPGSEDVEINYMEAEDAEASNSGGFNQLDISSFPKDLEVEKDMDKKAYLRKKANSDTGESLKSKDFITGDSAKSEYFATIFSDIVSDLHLSMQGFASHSGLNLDIHMPGFLVKNEYDNTFNPDDWTLKFFRFVALNADFESGPGKSNHPERVPNIVKGWRALYLAGEQTGDAYENAMQDAFDYGSFSFLNLDDDMFHSLAGIANAMVRLKELKQEYNSVRVSGVQNSSVNSSQPRGSVVQMELLDFPPGTELKDIVGTNSYKILSASELILKKDDGSSMTINSSNAAKNGVDWSLLVQNLSDDTKTMVSDMVVEGSYKKDFNISKVSKNMREELIKLNSALNGLGYRNLVKIASSYSLKWNDHSEVKAVDYIELGYNEFDWFETSAGNFVLVDFENREIHSFVNPNTKFSEVNMTKLNTRSFDESGLFIKKDRTEVERWKKESYGETSAAAGASGSAPKPASKKRTPVTTWEGYIASAGNNEELKSQYTKIRQLWSELVDTEIQTRKTDADKKADRLHFSQYVRWWRLTYPSGGGGPDEVIKKLLETIRETARTTSESASAPAAATSVQPSQPTSSVMSVTETVNGKPSVSIGTRGGDQIYLVLESVDRGIPLLYRKDNRTGQIKEMTSNEVIQFKNSLNNREIRRLEDAISRATKSPERAEAFKRYMKLQRRDNRFGRFGEKRREKKMQAQSEEMKSNPSDDSVKSARQSRLDTLRKKGVI